jgi:hypothetical protein
MQQPERNRMAINAKLSPRERKAVTQEGRACKLFFSVS